MRIIYLHQYFSIPAGHTGTRSYEFAKRLIANGHQVCMITSSAMLPAEYRSIEKTTALTIAGIPTIVIPVPYSNTMSFSQRIRAFFKFALLASREAMRQRGDVVFATSTPLTIALPGIMARLWQQIPMVFEVRDLWPELPMAVGALKNPLAKAAARGLEWTAYHSATHIVACSPGMAVGVIKRGIRSDRVTVIPNSCDIDLFDVPAERGQPIRDRLGLVPGQPLVLYTGTFGLINGVEYLVEIAAITQKLAPDVRYLLVGEGAQYNLVRSRAEALGVLGRNLWIWEPVPKAELVDVMAAATIATSLFVPLKAMWNNSANKFFDALAAGKPIAINYGGWQADLLNESGAGLVLPADDAEQAAHDLAAFATDAGWLRQAAAASRLLARTFNRDDMAQKLEAVLYAAIQK